MSNPINNQNPAIAGAEPPADATLPRLVRLSPLLATPSRGTLLLPLLSHKITLLFHHRLNQPPGLTLATLTVGFDGSVVYRLRTVRFVACWWHAPVK